MVRTSIIALLCAAAVVLCGCNKEENYFPTPTSRHNITLSAGPDEVDSKATFDKDGHFYWLPADSVGVATTASNSFSKLTLNSGEYATSGTFTGEIEGTVGTYAVYPYNEHHKIDSTTLTYHLPDTYTYNDLDHDYFAAGSTSYNNSTNAPAYGVISVDDEGNAYTTFKHLCGVLCIRVTGLKSKSGYITLTADRKITGDFTADLSKEEPKISTSSKAETTSSERTVTINYSSNTYDGTSGVDGVFYIPMPVGNYYLTMEVGYEDGFGKTMRITKEFSHTESIARTYMNRCKLNYSTMAKGSYVMYHGHKFVDLGLSSGIFWAETNVGADTSADYGEYYLWADAAAAAKTWGNKCSLPTKAQAQELLDNCTFTSESSGELGRFTSKASGNTNSIVLPAARFYYLTEYSGYAFDGTDQGAYWTSDADEDADTEAYELEIWPSGSWTGVQTTLRTHKNTVRPVLKVE